ncbi:MAG: putative globin-like protein [Chlamydiales bacterium]|nr:putative globin-like protein [Chlamydiales bacterium]
MSHLPILKAKKSVVNRPGLKVVHFNLSKGDIIPEHATNVDVVVTVIRGKGIFTINGIPHEMAPGVILDMPPHAPHSIQATENLEFVAIHMHLATQPTPIHCGAEDAFSKEK